MRTVSTNAPPPPVHQSARAVDPKPYSVGQIIGLTVILVVAFAIYDVARGRELQPVGYVILLILWPPAMLAGRAIYSRRMRRRARRQG